MKKRAHEHLEPVEQAFVRNINAKFESRLPDILESISTSLMVIEPVVQDVTVSLREFLDYLEFEIQKVKLQIASDEWESVVDVRKVADAKAWLDELNKLRMDFNIERMTSSVNFIRSMVDRVKTTFNMPKLGPLGEA
jgi:hypothetical protein